MSSIMTKHAVLALLKPLVHIPEHWECRSILRQHVSLMYSTVRTWWEECETRNNVVFVRPFTDTRK